MWLNMKLLGELCVVWFHLRSLEHPRVHVVNDLSEDGLVLAFGDETERVLEKLHSVSRVAGGHVALLRSPAFVGFALCSACTSASWFTTGVPSASPLGPGWFTTGVTTRAGPGRARGTHGRECRFRRG